METGRTEITLYVSDPVLQITAMVCPLDELYRICEYARSGGARASSSSWSAIVTRPYVGGAGNFHTVLLPAVSPFTNCFG